MRRLCAFLSDLDARAWRMLVVSFLLIGGVGLVFVLGAPLMGVDSERTVEGWLTAAHGPWALPVAIGAFALLAFVGTPQIVLIAAAVVAFGPWTGAVYSWIGTLVSALVGFQIGRAAGARTLDRFSGPAVKRFMTLVGENGFMASLVVRLVPSAPFIVVNMAAGVTPMRARDFAAGTALGIVPKIALTAFAGASIFQLMRGEIGKNGLIVVGVAVVWLTLGWFARRWLQGRRRQEDKDQDAA
jgi:uncharacterized membrane protein YdjX (TVP38/TMEM64 family)